MKRLAGLSALALIISSTSGCGWLWGPEGYFRDRGSDYLEARQTAPMQLPPDVEAKRLDPLLPVPMNVAESRSEGEFEVPRPQALQAKGEVSDYSLQKSGDSRWVVAQRVPAEVWPVARQFFEDGGFRVVDERPQTGEFTPTGSASTNSPAPWPAASAAASVASSPTANCVPACASSRACSATPARSSSPP